MAYEAHTIPMEAPDRLAENRTRGMQVPLYRRHEWDVSPREAIRIQNDLAREVIQERLASPPGTIAGVDVSFERTGVKQYMARCGIAVLSLPDLELVDHARWQGVVTFPYVPGLLSFREIPAVIEALGRLSVRPDVFMADGQGRAHPRRFGLACHLGVLLDLPVLGVAKKRLIGEHEDLAPERGSCVPLLDSGEVVGSVLRTRTRVKPVYVSVGHHLSLSDAVFLTLACAPRFRIPEPTRRAHLLSRTP